MEVVKNENLRQLIRQVEPDFTTLARIHNAVTYEAEASFALQLLNDNDYLARVASGNPDSLKRAVINVAAIGLTLNPARPLAYLVPRKGKICLDIGYRGLVHLAAEAKAIMWAVAETVHEKDKYETNGVGREPTHKREPFGDRGKVVGAYCVAKTYSGEFIVTEMSAAEINGIRDRSESWKSGTHSPWKSDPSEMMKKTVIRRASKSWSLVDTRFNRALEIADGADPVDLGPPPAALTDNTAQLLKDVRAHLSALGKTEAAYLTYATRQFKREKDIQALEELTQSELEEAEKFLRGNVNAQIAKELKSEAAREKAV